MAGSTEPGENLVRMEGGSSASDELVKSKGDLLCPSLCYLAPSLSAFLILLVRKNLQKKTSREQTTSRVGAPYSSCCVGIR